MAQEIAERKGAISSATEETQRRGGGRPAARQGATKQETADALGIGVATLVRAEQHVAAVETLGVPAELSQGTA